MRKNARLSVDLKYRYMLTRQWGPGSRAKFLMLNPSTADATVDDPTVKTCIALAKNWGQAGLDICNLYAYRATDPRQLLTVQDPVGPLNNTFIRSMVCDSDGPVIFAWGRSGIKVPGFQDRVREVGSIALGAGVHTFYCLDTTKDGTPRHPLYMKHTTPLKVWHRQVV